MPSRFSVTVSQVVRYGGALIELSVVANGKFPQSNPGQFFHLAIDSYDPSTFWPESRAFSIANSSNFGEFDFLISRAGDFVERLWAELEPGLTLWLKGPYGELDMELMDVPKHADVMFVAAGSGISPFTSLISALLPAGGSDTRFLHLLYSARSFELLVKHDFFEALSSRSYGQLNTSYFITRSEAPQSLHNVKNRRMTSEDAISLIRPRISAHFFLSGPHLLVSKLRKDLEGAGIESASIHFDDWG